MANIGIRVDGSNSLGMGNFFRSLALGKKLIQKGHKVSFITKGLKEAFHFTEDRNLHFFLLSPNSCNGTLNAQMSQIVADEKINILINDVKDTDQPYMTHLRTLKLKIINFDDLGPGRELAHVLIDAFIPPKEASDQKYCYGPQYAMLRSEFTDSAPAYKISKDVKRIAVLLGATNAGSLLPSVLGALQQLPDAIECHIILGQSIPHRELYQVDFPEDKFFYHYSPSSIANIFKLSHLAITAGGMAMCESCALGVPTLVIPQVPHEEHNAMLFQEKGAVLALPYQDIQDPETILAQIQRLVQSKELRRNLSQSAKNWVDGKGLYRILDKVSCLLPN